MDKKHILLIFAFFLAFSGCIYLASEPKFITNNSSKETCGDSICDEIEKQNNVCPADCANATSSSSCDLNRDGKVDEIERERCGTQNQPGNGECGDGICDEIEQKNSVCQEDCGSANFTDNRTPIAANVVVDYDSELGEFSTFLFGTLGGPYFDENGFEKSAEANFQLVEVWAQIENSRVPSDPDDPSEYNFTLLDQQVAAIIEGGAEPLVGFGPSKVLNTTQYATYAANVVKHLTQGWGDGHYWSVRVFRFGNEPESRMFWNGTREDFFEAYSAWAKALKEVNESFILDSPGFMNIYEMIPGQKGFTNTGKINSFATEFLEYCDENDVPLDVFSFHVYAAEPYAFYNNTKAAYELVQKYNTSPLYGTPKLGNDEWNLMVGDLWSGRYMKEFDTTWAGAHNINSLINMVEQGLELSIKYGGTFNGVKGCHDFPITDCDNEGKPSFYAFKAFNSLAGSVQLETEGTDRMNLAAIAGKDGDSIIIVISNYDIRKYASTYSNKPAEQSYKSYVSAYGEAPIYDSFSLTIEGAPWDSETELVYEHYLVDDSHNLTLVENQTISGGSELSIDEEMDAPSVHLIKIYEK